MLKKAGIVVAAAAAGLLALSPLAFAGSKGGHDQGHDGGSNKTVTNTLTQEGDGGNNACSNEQESENGDAGASLLGVIGLVPVLNNSSNSVLNNVNALQCVNLLNNFLNDNDVDVAVLGSTGD